MELQSNTLLSGRLQSTEQLSRVSGPLLLTYNLRLVVRIAQAGNCTSERVFLFAGLHFIWGCGRHKVQSACVPHYFLEHRKMQNSQQNPKHSWCLPQFSSLSTLNTPTCPIVKGDSEPIQVDPPLSSTLLYGFLVSQCHILTTVLKVHDSEAFLHFPTYQPLLH